MVEELLGITEAFFTKVRWFLISVNLQASGFRDIEKRKDRYGETDIYRISSIDNRLVHTVGNRASINPGGKDYKRDR